ncbi:hypothetical protein [Pedobacter sp. B4-66]|uniref:hypothetical protein n=1 Tax=Pedobacter sp. B4-66 TaxID=2817280 RepID=UPI001BDB051D|nr:hypothetical protein [Pedobacter sp. B4-66]
MKKQLKTSIMAIALLASVTGAFASDISNALSGKKQTTYNWQKYNRNTGLPTGPVVPGTSTNPFPEDCQNQISALCAIGTPVGGGTPIVLRYKL